MRSVGAGLVPALVPTARPVRCMWVAGALTLALVGCGSTTDVNTEERTAKDELRVCFAENDPPRSLRGGTGFDTDIAREIAAQLDRRLVTVWIPDLRAVSSSPMWYQMPPSPVKHTTGRSGCAHLAPMAAGRPQPRDPAQRR